MKRNNKITGINLNFIYLDRLQNIQHARNDFTVSLAYPAGFGIAGLVAVAADVKMIDIAGTADQRQYRNIVTDRLLNGLCHASRPVRRNQVAAHRIVMIADIAYYPGDPAVLLDREDGDFVVNRAFRTVDIRVKFAGIGGNRAVFHPVTAVEGAGIVVDFGQFQG